MTIAQNSRRTRRKPREQVYITLTALAARWGVGIATASGWCATARARGQLRQYHPTGSTCLYRLSQVEAMEESWPADWPKKAAGG